MNYRKNLWTAEEAQATMIPMMKHVDISIGNEEDAEKCLGVAAEGVDVTAGELNPDAYRPVVQELVDRFDFKKVGITLRESQSADDNDWSAIYYDGEEILIGKKYPVRIVDRVGGGDSFCAAMIYGQNQGDWGSRQVLDFAVAASAMSHTFHGDFNLVSVKEVMAVAGGDTSGRVQR